MNSNSSFLKSGIWYTLTNIFVKGLVLLTTPIFTRLLTQDDFGAFNNYISWLSIFIILVTLNLDSTLVSAKYDFKTEFDSYILSMLSLSSISAFIWLLITNIYIDIFKTFLGMNYIYINTMIIYLFFLPAINMFQERERLMFEYKKTALVSLTLAIVTAFLSVLLVVTMENKLDARIFGASLPTIIIGLVLFCFFVYKGKKVKTRYWKYALPICLPYIPHLLSLTLLNTIDRVMIDKWCGNTATALYSLAYTCGTMVNLLMISLNSAYVPWLAEMLIQNRVSDIRKHSYIYILAFFLLAIGIILVSPEILYVLGGREYLSAVYVLAPVSIGCVCQFLYTMFVNIEQLKKKTIGMAFASLTAALVNIVLNYLFIPMFGYIAAAYTTLCGYLCLLIIHMYLVKLLKLNNVYDYKFIGTVILCGLIFMGFMMVTYSYDMLRFIIILVYISVLGMLFLKNKFLIIDFLKKRG